MAFCSDVRLHRHCSRGAEVAKRAVGIEGDNDTEWQEKAKNNETRVHELEKEVQDLQKQLSSIKSQAFSVPWPPPPPGHNPADNAPIMDPQTPHFPKETRDPPCHRV